MVGSEATSVLEAVRLLQNFQLSQKVHAIRRLARGDVGHGDSSDCSFMFPTVAIQVRAPKTSWSNKVPRDAHTASFTVLKFPTVACTTLSET